MLFDLERRRLTSLDKLVPDRHTDTQTLWLLELLSEPKRWNSGENEIHFRSTRASYSSWLILITKFAGQNRISMRTNECWQYSCVTIIIVSSTWAMPTTSLVLRGFVIKFHENKQKEDNHWWCKTIDSVFVCCLWLDYTLIGKPCYFSLDLRLHLHKVYIDDITFPCPGGVRGSQGLGCIS